MENLIKYISNNKIKCYFISPHLDDAILSCGNLIRELSTKTEIIIINVFTKGGNKNTLSAKLTLKRAGYKNAKKYYADRIMEDKYVMQRLNIKVINLNFPEALWRKKSRVNIMQRFIGELFPELLHIYPSYRFHITKGKIARADKKIFFQIHQKLNMLNKNSYVFCPSGIGEHVDHVIVNRVCKKLMVKTIFWEDFPYNLNSQSEIKKADYIFKGNWYNKAELIKLYKTQFHLLFPSGAVPKKSERYFL